MQSQRHANLLLPRIDCLNLGTGLTSHSFAGRSEPALARFTAASKHLTIIQFRLRCLRQMVDRSGFYLLTAFAV